MIRERALYLIAVVVFTALALVVAAQKQPAASSQSESESVHKIGEEGLETPQLVRQTMPEYTEEAKKEHVEGKVLLSAVIRKDGSIDSFKVLKTPGYGLEEQAIEEIAKNWEFKPGKKDGAPVDVQVSIEIAFTLK